MQLSCKKELQEQEIIAKIGKQVITAKDLIYRAETTVRPARFQDKNIILSNLIAEKLLAQQLADTSSLLKNPSYLGFINGIKEQMMREQLYYHVAFDQVKLDSVELLNNYRVSGYEYNLQFYRINKQSLADTLTKRLEHADAKGKEEIFSELEEHLDKKPMHKIKWDDPDADVIHEALYTDVGQQGEIIGPLKLAKNDYIIMKIIDWTYTPTIGNENYQLKLKNIEEKLKQEKAKKLWYRYILNLMKDKKLEFNRQVMKKLADLFYEISLSNTAKKELNLDKNMMEGDSTLSLLERAVNDPEFLDEPFFTIDNIKFTVKDFKKMLRSHPLVYREKYSNKNDFQKQFRLAVADLVRDHYLNKEAYKESLDKHPLVKKRVEIWKDALQADYQVREYLKEIKKRDDFDERLMKGDHNYLAVYVDSLYDKNHYSISINSEQLNKINLTKIQTVVMQPGVPYPFPFPNTPLYIPRNKIDHYKLTENK
jgi:hypothetical protein